MLAMCTAIADRYPISMVAFGVSHERMQSIQLAMWISSGVPEVKDAPWGRFIFSG